MKINKLEPPRRFSVGMDGEIEISDCAHITLETREMAIVNSSSGNYHWEVIRHDWGFALPLSLNRPIGTAGLQAVVSGKNYMNSHLLLFDPAKETLFETYENNENHQRFMNLQHENHSD